jgi:cytochrome c oxidase assembly protein subunit 11
VTDEQAGQAARDTERSNRKVAAVSATVAAGMLALAFASVPLYRLFCQVTGYGGTTQKAAAPSNVVLDRVVTVRFDANVSSGLAWRVEPLQRTIDVKLGETTLVAYRATNLSDKAIVGTSGFNVSPDITGSFFNKLECFCFTEQKLEPGQSLDMPVSFFVDPAMLRDSDARKVQQITLSYTFYLVDKPKTAAVSAGGRS